MGSGLAKRDHYKAIKHFVKHGTEVHGDKIGKLGHGFIRYAGHGLLALSSTTMDKGFFGVDAIRPDSIALALAGVGYVFGGKKAKKLAASSADAAFHALITRLVLKGRTVLVHGPDGWTFKTAT